MINKIILRNIKCFASQEFPFSGLNILTGINGAGKSTVIQSILLVAQTEKSAFIEFNGSLIELGDYSDLQHENAQDDGACISIESDSGTCSWGYDEGFECDKDEFVTHLPLIDGAENDLSRIKENLIYISAERWGPRANVPLNTHNPNP